METITPNHEEERHKSVEKKDTKRTSNKKPDDFRKIEEKNRARTRVIPEKEQIQRNLKLLVTT